MLLGKNLTSAGTTLGCIKNTIQQNNLPNSTFRQKYIQYVHSNHSHELRIPTAQVLQLGELCYLGKHKSSS